ncbi:hypothetical protein [Roseateles amylovorans]|uniref:DUF4019 domain-containing protein n=1 Tax=Roseateles amylovorans TaxID=2978473 RepID=A0ABY6AU36_9BURK|nr:hypothetical protein [Roseateles amylovorans]UXH76187.1 hypothetical protein N4261_14015 [Roseateles amylovorans]
MKLMPRILSGAALLCCAGALWAADVPLGKTSPPNRKSMVVETVYPYTVYEYQPAIEVPLFGTGEQPDLSHPEKLLKAHFNYIRTGDYDRNFMLWTAASRQLMEAADKRGNRTKDVWKAVWARAYAGHKMELTHWVTYGRYVLLQYRVSPADGTTPTEATVVVVKEGNEWRLTQELRADPVAVNWRTSPGRIQVPSDALLPPDPLQPAR